MDEQAKQFQGYLGIFVWMPAASLSMGLCTQLSTMTLACFVHLRLIWPFLNSELFAVLKNDIAIGSGSLPMIFFTSIARAVTL